MRNVHANRSLAGKLVIKYVNRKRLSVVDFTLPFVTISTRRDLLYMRYLYYYTFSCHFSAGTVRFFSYIFCINIICNYYSKCIIIITIVHRRCRRDRLFCCRCRSPVVPPTRCFNCSSCTILFLLLSAEQSPKSRVYVLFDYCNCRSNNQIIGQLAIRLLLALLFFETSFSKSVVDFVVLVQCGFNAIARRCRHVCLA